MGVNHIYLLNIFFIIKDTIEKDALFRGVSSGTKTGRGLVNETQYFFDYCFWNITPGLVYALFICLEGLQYTVKPG